jgi:GntR family transcriptional repressor for pyruvate dehydrogenase complex
MINPSRTAAEDIAEDLRGQIAVGALRPGQLLPPEGALFQRYGVARPTMRGALRILESDGLLTIERGHRGGPRVTEAAVATLARRVGLHLQLRGADLRELVEAQAIIQPGAVAEAARVRDDADLARLREAVAACRAATTTTERIQAGEGFGEALLAASHNRVLSLYAALTATLLQEQLGELVARWGMTEPGIVEAFGWSVEQFATVVDLIEAGAAEEAERFWAAYLRRSRAMPTGQPSPFQLSRGAAPLTPRG